MTLLAQDREGMPTLLDAIQEFEKWSGIPVNSMKTKQMTVDDIEDNREIIEELKYHGESLPIAPESESVRYLGFWATPNGNMQAAKDLVYDRTLRGKETSKGTRWTPNRQWRRFQLKRLETLDTWQQSRHGDRENWTD